MAASCSLGMSMGKKCFLMCSELSSQQYLEMFHHLSTALQPTSFAPQTLACVWPCMYAHEVLKTVQLLLCSSILFFPCWEKYISAMVAASGKISSQLILKKKRKTNQKTFFQEADETHTYMLTWLIYFFKWEFFMHPFFYIWKVITWIVSFKN